MHIRIQKLRKTATIPSYQTAHSAGMDVCAAIDKAVIVKPLEIVLIPCGFAIELPEGYEAQIRARSGLALKHGIAMANGIGTIDADYRGEVGAIIINLGQKDYTINPNDRIAQMVITRYEKADLNEVATLNETDRGDGAFGSTGIHSK